MRVGKDGLPPRKAGKSMIQFPRSSWMCKHASVLTCYGSNCIPPKFTCGSSKVLPIVQNVTVFRHRAFLKMYVHFYWSPLYIFHCSRHHINGTAFCRLSIYTIAFYKSCLLIVSSLIFLVCFYWLLFLLVTDNFPVSFMSNIWLDAWDYWF